MVHVHEAACKITEPWITTRGSKPQSEEVWQSILAAGFQIVTQQKNEEEAMEQRYNLSDKKDRKAQFRCCTCYKHVCLTVCLLHSTHVIDESKNKINMSKLYTHNYNVFHCFVRDIF